MRIYFVNGGGTGTPFYGKVADLRKFATLTRQDLILVYGDGKKVFILGA